jgi:hypothetical protein
MVSDIERECLWTIVNAYIDAWARARNETSLMVGPFWRYAKAIGLVLPYTRRNTL